MGAFTSSCNLERYIAEVARVVSPLYDDQGIKRVVVVCVINKKLEPLIV